jgi:hypothetical protein
MAVTRISDVIVPEVFAAYMAKDTTEKTEIFRSGILRPDADLSAKLAGGGRTFNVPFWKDLDNTESGPGSDDPAAVATPGKLTSGKDIARRQIRTRGFSTADLAGVLAGDDPMQRIVSRINPYWDRQFQSILVNTLTGVFADNAANDSGDMIVDIGTDATGAPAASELISAEAVIDASYTMGDNAEGLKVIVMHSTIKKRLEKLNLIDFIPDARGEIQFPYYLGKRVVVDDGCRRVTGTNRIKYWTYLVGDGAFGWAENGANIEPVEVERKPDQGNGLGVENIWTRRQFALHPYGIKFTDTTVTGEFPSNANLALAANWDRVYAERKQIPIAALVTNG